MKQISNFQQLSGHLASFGAYAIFGFNIIVCKDLTSSNLISPLALFSLRSIGAGLLFWLLSAFIPEEKVATKDYPKIFAASLLGFLMTQMTFLVGIPHVTPMTCSIMSSMTPVYTMFIAAIAIKEPISIQKASGVAISLAGALFLVFNSVARQSDVIEDTPFGLSMIFLNGLSFALYLGIFKPLIGKYHVVTFMKWIFLFSTLVSFPITAKEIVTIPWCTIPANILFELGFLILMATFVSYFLIPIGQKRLRPTLVSMYSYVQPIIATVISIIIGMDQLSWQKILSMTLVFTGVAIVSRSRKKQS